MSSDRDRLKYYFQAKGTTIDTTPSEAKSEVFLGGGLTGGGSCAGYSEVLIGSGSAGCVSSSSSFDGVGVPLGGSEGQVLAKASDNDFDTEWVNQTGGGGGGGAVDSVNGETGVVVLDAADVGAEPTLGFTPEDVANKSTSVADDAASDTKYPSVKAVFDWSVDLLDEKVDIAGDTMTGQLSVPSLVVQSGEESLVWLNEVTSEPTTTADTGVILFAEDKVLAVKNRDGNIARLGTNLLSSNQSFELPDVSGTILTSKLQAANILVGDVSDLASPVSVSGDATLSESGVLELADVGTPGTYTKVTTDDKGRVTSGTSIGASDLPTGIDATKIADGTVTNTEFQYINSLTSNAQTQINASESWFFGNGSDGDLTISSGTTAITRDYYYNNVTITGTAQLRAGTYKIFVAGTLDLSNAPQHAISSARNSAGSPSGTAGGSGASGVTGVSIGSAGAGGAGSSGTTGVGAQAAAPTNFTAGAGANGGAGGAGGAGTPNAGGASRAGASVTIPFPIRNVRSDLFRGSTLVNGGAGGAGGSAGGGDGTNSARGAPGGGGGGGVVFIAANIINRDSTNTAVGAISADGSNGGVGVASTVGNCGGSGGGGGGGGGWIYLVYREAIGTAKTGMITANGGNGSAGGDASGTGTGGTGGAGGAGGRIFVCCMCTGVGSESFGTGGASGTAGSGTSGGAGGAGETLSVNL